MSVLSGLSEIGRWAYIPTTDPSMQKTSGARAVSEAGPLLTQESSLWDLKSSLLGAIGNLSLAMNPDEELVFGRAEGKAFDPFSNLTLRPLSFKAARTVMMSEANMRDGDIVLTVWPGQLMSPAFVESQNNIFALHLPSSIMVQKGSRCFVLDEAGAGLITTSYPSVDGQTCRLSSPLSLRSWLLASNSSCFRGRPFMLMEEEDGFIITDLEDGNKYIGKFFNKDAGRLEEAEELRLAVRLFGLRGAIASYDLQRRK